MAFTETEKAALLTVKGVGEKVIMRLEQMGIDSLDKLALANPQDITEQAASLVGSSCWKNSPQAKAAITMAVDFASAKTQKKAI
ncbi:MULTISPECIES: helix-hairpin-helix domain-containing protein [Snodgrassella]|uniref:helix-hairpin-helix domain-containing protein n=1 Tax=Snodgrassella TaxID=1193515 RepID=UPI0004D79FF7|nr:MULTISPECIES: helix-hairpin-helix domain-containing protein [Snodgrassella]KES10569.1 Pathogenicity locus [Snodgrassella alvi SCGC AB-598-O11]MBI0067145.1 helix-hairpin-helix domain-containing protein [Snodgrassella sp. M0110]MBI0075936.1 helix-hairpin-helix domain-containing protein [Snodgrassella sp. M0118]MBI0078446.1 helix-hairpin-helix domain-containing protein [Snodgrassella sp. M0112]NUF78877.1 helix-hairpin-helix domain-containing protein [Snodgrassella sp. ESL0323]